MLSCFYGGFFAVNDDTVSVWGHPEALLFVLQVRFRFGPTRRPFPPSITSLFLASFLQSPSWLLCVVDFSWSHESPVCVF